VPGIDGQIQRILLRIASPSSIFARFSPLRLCPVSKLEEMVRRKETIREQLIVETEIYFEGLDKSYYSDGLKKRIEESLDQAQVYRVERRLC